MIPSVLIAVSFQFRSLRSSHKFIAIKIFYLSIWVLFFFVLFLFGNVTEVIKNFLRRIYEQTGPGSAFVEHLEAQILKMYPLDANHGGAFVDSIYVPVCQKKSWTRHCMLFLCHKYYTNLASARLQHTVSYG